VEYAGGIYGGAEPPRNRPIEDHRDDVARARGIAGHVAHDSKTAVLRPEWCCGKNQREDAPLDAHGDRAEDVSDSPSYDGIMQMLRARCKTSIPANRSARRSARAAIR
jgi:hypothetical protein